MRARVCAYILALYECSAVWIEQAAVVELFFSFDGLQLPPRPAHYRDHTESDLGVSEVTGRAGAPEMH